MLVTIDLHSHVFPRSTIDAMLREPDRFGTRSKSGNGIKVRQKDGEIYWDNNGRLSGIEPELYDVDAKIDAMDRMRVDVSAISVAPPTYLYWLPADTGLEVSKLHNDGIA